ncbi:MAG: hypothetical protein EOQ44_25480 [Mesorhizobium sp.]|nr:MAG: hypothetical protein EOQ44_25480 [Mesorhizobium sp.]
MVTGAHLLAVQAFGDVGGPGAIRTLLEGFLLLGQAIGDCRYDCRGGYSGFHGNQQLGNTGHYQHFLIAGFVVGALRF